MASSPTPTDALPTSVPAAIQAELDTPYEPTAEQIERFRADGFVKLRDFFSPELLAFFDPIMTACLHAHNPLRDQPLEDRDTYGKAFIQVGNLWQKNDVAAKLSCSARAASAAARLMGVPGTRMYHEQALYKEASGGFTPWHVDQHYWPLDTPHTCTIWFPFTAVPLEMGPLSFGRGSHLRQIARDIGISDESERLIRDEIKAHKILESFEPYDLGEVSFHYGWTLHRAGGNTTDEARRVMTVIYMERDARMIEPQRDAHRNDARDWSPSTRPGEIMDDDLNPILFEES